jgi:hypothetical protein
MSKIRDCVQEMWVDSTPHNPLFAQKMGTAGIYAGLRGEVSTQVGGPLEFQKTRKRLF